MEIIRNTISVSRKHLEMLETEFKVSRMTVYNALKDITQSGLAKKIRKKAKQLLLDEANSIES